ncbi:electron transfer flavoprotein subunit beta/FixA family protein [Chloroflexota bacterium]
MVNPADLAALELAVRTKEQVGGEVVLLTVGSFVPANDFRPTDITLETRGLRNNADRLRSPDPIRRCLATGADRVIVIGLNKQPENQGTASGADSLGRTEMLPVGFRPLNLDSMLVATILVQSIRRLNAGLVFCGEHSYDQGNGLVGPAIAELLDMPLITGALSVTIEQSKRSLLVQRRLQKGERELVRCGLPAVVATTTGGITPRYFTLPALINAFKTSMETSDLATLGLPLKEASKTRSARLVGLYSPRPRTRKIFIPDASLPPEVRARLAMSGGMNQSDQKGQLIEGDPEQVAAEVIQFLQSQGILPPE